MCLFYSPADEVMILTYFTFDIRTLIFVIQILGVTVFAELTNWQTCSFDLLTNTLSYAKLTRVTKKIKSVDQNRKCVFSCFHSSGSSYRDYLQGFSWKYFKCVQRGEWISTLICKATGREDSLAQILPQFLRASLGVIVLFLWACNSSVCWVLHASMQVTHIATSAHLSECSVSQASFIDALWGIKGWCVGRGCFNTVICLPTASFQLFSTVLFSVPPLISLSICLFVLRHLLFLPASFLSLTSIHFSHSVDLSIYLFYASISLSSLSFSMSTLFYLCPLRSPSLLCNSHCGWCSRKQPKGDKCEWLFYSLARLLFHRRYPAPACDRSLASLREQQ